MIKIPVIGQPEMDEAKVICLETVRKRHEGNLCRHMQVEVDETLAEVNCKTCGEKLNPIAVLARLASEESRLRYRIEQNHILLKKLAKRQRCKCEHCKQMTRIRFL